jgi:hypothetical protein
MTGKYILEGHTPVAVDDVLTWARWYETAARHVATTNVGEVHVSTVFIGLDHAFQGGPPILFETMIFGGKQDGYFARYSTWEEAEAGHASAVTLAEGRS